MTNPTLVHLLTRRSVSANSLGEPGPSPAEIEQILTAAARVPDHKKLVPWRFVLFEGEARKAFGQVLAEVCRKEEPDPGPFRLETEANRFMRAPLVIAVVSRVTKILPRRNGSKCSYRAQACAYDQSYPRPSSHATFGLGE